MLQSIIGAAKHNFLLIQTVANFSNNSCNMTPIVLFDTKFTFLSVGTNAKTLKALLFTMTWYQRFGPFLHGPIILVKNVQ